MTKLMTKRMNRKLKLMINGFLLNVKTNHASVPCITLGDIYYIAREQYRCMWIYTETKINIIVHCFKLIQTSGKCRNNLVYSIRI